MGFEGFRSGALTQLTDRGLMTCDLEDDVRAFNKGLPRIRIIPIKGFDSLDLL